MRDLETLVEEVTAEEFRGWIVMEIVDHENSVESRLSLTKEEKQRLKNMNAIQMKEMGIYVEQVRMGDKRKLWVVHISEPPGYMNSRGEWSQSARMYFNKDAHERRYEEKVKATWLQWFYSDYVKFK